MKQHVQQLEAKHAALQAVASDLQRAYRKRYPRGSADIRPGSKEFSEWTRVGLAASDAVQAADQAKLGHAAAVK